MTAPATATERDESTRFAVVIPLYNKRPHIVRALSSALDQSHPATEIIVVDDASTDGGLEVVSEFNDDRLTILHRPEPGPGGYAARNLAIEHATADWIAFLDADDAWLHDHLAGLDQAVHAAPANSALNGVFSGYTIREADGRARPDLYTARYGRNGCPTYDFAAFLDFWLSLADCPIWTSAAAFPRQRLIDVGLFPAGRCRRGGDKDLWLRAAHGGTVRASPAVSAVYHRDAVNMVTSREMPNTRHCLCATVAELQSRETEPMRRKLRRLVNQEILQYARQATKAGPAARTLLDDYYLSEGPLGALLLSVLATRPGAAGARAVRRLRDLLRQLLRGAAKP
jgi:succinoglycan biosynthesis protein ExoO